MENQEKIPIGFGLGLCLAGPIIAVQNEAPREKIGAAVGLSRFFQSLGGALGISLLTAFETWRSQNLLQAAVSAAARTSALVTAFDEILMVLVICDIVAFCFSLFLKGRVRRKSSEQKKDTETPKPIGQ